MIHNTSLKFFLVAMLCVMLFALHSCDEKSPIASVEKENSSISLDKHSLSSTSAADLLIYDDALASPWINASWSANVTFNTSEQSYAGTNSMKVAMTSAWGALSLHYGNWYTTGIDPSMYAAIEFAAYGATSGANLSVFFENDAGQSFPAVNYGVIVTGQWITVSIPMNQLNPNGLEINRVAIQDVSGGIQTFYIDEFRFAGTATGTPPSAPSLSSPANGATGVATNPTVSWNTSSGATSYHLQVSTNSAFSSPVVDQINITSTSYTVSDLSSNTTYYWRVNASNSDGTSDWSPIWNFATMTASTSVPDLTVDENVLRSSVQVRYRTLSSNSCAVVEGCASAGRRKLLRFTVIVPNYGTADLFFGDPADNPQLFEWSPCHGHYHFTQFAEYRLLTRNNARLVTGRKQAFCLLDSKQYWSGYPSRGYSCDYQGISVGWGDVYDRSIDCQWLDITGIAAGNYVLEVEVNVGGVIDEGENQWTNVVRVPVSIQ